MEWLSNLISYGLAAAGVVFVSTNSIPVSDNQPDNLSTSPETISQPTQTDTATASPRRLTVTVKVAEPTLRISWVYGICVHFLLPFLLLCPLFSSKLTPTVFRL